MTSSRHPAHPSLLLLVAAAWLALGAAGAQAGPVDDPDGTAATEAEAEVLVFVTSWCPVCRQATSWFKAEGIPHLALDVESDPRAMALYRRAGGDGAVPLILVGRESIRGFDERAVRRALDRLQAVPPTPEDPADPAEPASGIEESVGADGKKHYRVEETDIGGDVHGPQVEFVTTRPDVDEASEPDPAMEPEKKLPLPDSDEEE